MADIDPKVSQKIFKDYSRGIGVSDISQRHGVTPQVVKKVVKFESVVHTRVQEALDKAAKTQKPTTPKSSKPKAGAKG